ncbi:hypothetical protein NC652_032639 [Populus alba x Populus x berolinensis]|nr:hypothetical protein NC652_032639 [Populus alba x Populus x berolinensis]
MLASELGPDVQMKDRFRLLRCCYNLDLKTAFLDLDVQMKVGATPSVSHHESVRGFGLWGRRKRNNVAQNDTEENKSAAKENARGRACTWRGGGGRWSGFLAGDVAMEAGGGASISDGGRGEKELVLLLVRLGSKSRGGWSTSDFGWWSKERVWCSCRVRVKTMVTIGQPLTVEILTCYSLWCGRPGVACYCCQRKVCGSGPVEDAALDCWMFTVWKTCWGWCSCGLKEKTMTMETKAKTMVMVGDVCSAERGGQCYCGGSFGLKPERKRTATEGLLWLFLVTRKKRRKEAGRRGQRRLI